MKIIVDVKSILPEKNGISKYFSQFLTFWILNNSNDTFYLIYPDTKKKLIIPYFKNVIHKKLSFDLTKFNFLNIFIYNIFTFRYTVFKIKPDLIFSPYHDILMPKSFKSVITIHDLCFYKLNKIYDYKTRYFYNIILKLNIKRVSKILTVSQSTKNEIINYFKFNSENIEIIPNPFKIENFKFDNFILEKSKFNILYNGGVEKRKNLQLLFEVISYYEKNNPNIIFHLTGSKSNYTQFLSFDNFNNLNFTGSIDENELNEYLNSIQLIVYPSVCEGFGRPIIESLIFKKPIICYNLNLYREFNHPYIFYFYTKSEFLHNIDFVYNNHELFNPNLYILDNIYLQKNCNIKFLNFINSLTS